MIRIGEYELDPEHVLGRGGFGTVYGGFHAGRRVPVAIKVLEQRSDDRELRALCALHHPRIVTVHDVLSAVPPLPSGATCLVMERLEAKRLSSATGVQVHEVVLGLLDALAHAHARGIVHGDISPGNVLVDASGVRLIDFGLATFYRAAGAREVAGTPGFLAPEVRAGRWDEVGPQADVFGVGALAWVLRTGSPPPSLPPPPLDPAWDPWFARTLAPHPAQRFDRAADAARALVLAEAEAAAVAVETTRTMTVLMEPDALPERGPGASPVALAPCPATWRTEAQRQASTDLLSAFGAAASLHDLSIRPIVGRERERDALWDALVAVHQTGQSRTLALVGTPGIGRRRLARWLVERAHELGVGDADGPSAHRVHIRVTTQPLPDPRPVTLTLRIAEAADDVDVLAIGPLDRAAHALLVRDLLGLEPGLASRIEELTGGDPGFADQLVSGWRDQLVLGPYGLDADGDPPMPDIPLPPPTEARLTAAALGVSFALAEWEALCPD